MPNLYDNNYRYTQAALELDADVYDFLDEIFSKYLDKGYSPREISHILIGSVMLMEVIHIE